MGSIQARLEGTLLGRLWQTDFQVIPSSPHLLVFMLLGNPLTLSVARTWDVFLIYRVWQRGWDVTLVITLCYIRLCLSQQE